MKTQYQVENNISNTGWCPSCSIPSCSECTCECEIRPLHKYGLFSSIGLVLFIALTAVTWNIYLNDPNIRKLSGEVTHFNSDQSECRYQTTAIYVNYQFILNETEYNGVYETCVDDESVDLYKNQYSVNASTIVYYRTDDPNTNSLDKFDIYDKGILGLSIVFSILLCIFFLLFCIYIICWLCVICDEDH